MRETKNYIREHNLLTSLIEDIKKKNQEIFVDKGRELTVEETIEGIREIDKLRVRNRIVGLNSFINDCEVSLRDAIQMYPEDIETMQGDLSDARDERDRLLKISK